MASIADMCDRLEKVNASLDKRETVPLRAEQTQLMRDIQQAVQKQREAEGRTSVGIGGDAVLATEG